MVYICAQAGIAQGAAGQFLRIGFLFYAAMLG